MSEKQSILKAEEHLDDVLGDAGADKPETTLDTSDSQVEPAEIPNIHQAIVGIMRAIKALPKLQQTEAAGRYLFRGIDDVYNFIHPYLCEWGVYLTSEIRDKIHTVNQTSAGKKTNICVVQMRYKLTAEDGTSVTTDVAGEGSDPNDKSTAKALSMAYKYAFFQLLCIPIEQHDGDVGGPRKKANPKADPKAAKAPPRAEAVSSELITFIKNEWKVGQRDGCDTADYFKVWASDVAQREFNALKSAEWTKADAEKCCGALGIKP